MFSFAGPARPAGIFRYELAQQIIRGRRDLVLAVGDLGIQPNEIPVIAGAAPR